MATLDLRPGRCTCGCGQQVHDRFARGHAERLKSNLRRAHTGGQPVAVLLGKGQFDVPAQQAVTYLDGPADEWSAWLAEVTQR